MKKVIIVGLLSVALLGACEEPDVGASLGRLEVVGKDKVDSDITIFKDKETGCQYMNINAGYGQVIEPILNQDGKPYCPQN
ncbi:DUF6440 family protein [Bacillus cereus]|uniref:DUF6440 family protein n=1 Tax=Bacillus cereus TaxID=1396 RepID=UPI002AC1907C|nr:DUF6440 family protein [Bacillus cereus]MDZ4499726.1 DUF6440 family protein [Bacillus cereus]